MKKNSCLISIILDSSGSMESCRDDTIGGFNAFIDQQKQIPGECHISLYQFNDIYEKIYEHANIKNVSRLDRNTFVPHGSTALLDAMGKTIDNVGVYLDSLKEKERPDKVIVCILSDGAENSSRFFTKEKVFEMISHQRQKYGWQILFLGANQNAITVAASYGINPSTSMSYNINNTVSAWDSTSYLTSGIRCAANLVEVQGVSYSTKDRQSAVK